MATPVSFEIPHQLTQADVKSRLIKGLGDARGRFGQYMGGLTETWHDNRMEFAGNAMGQRVTGRVDIKPQSIRIEVDLPLLLAAFAQKLIPKVESEARKMLAKK